MFKFYSSIKIQKTKDQVCIICKNGITHIRILNKDMDNTIGTVQSYHKEENALVVYGYTDSEAKICIKTQHLHCRSDRIGKNSKKMKTEFSFPSVIENYLPFLATLQSRKAVVVFFAHLKTELMSFIKPVSFGFSSPRITLCFITDTNSLLLSCPSAEKKYMNWKIN